jgi:hypothetical protein
MIPVNAIEATYTKPLAQIPLPNPKPELKSKTHTMVAVELSNYSPSLTRHDITGLFESFAIAPDFKMGASMRFAYPLRTNIWIIGQDEAYRAVRQLDGTMVGTRRIRLALMDRENVEEKKNANESAMEVQMKKQDESEEVAVSEMADELIIAISSKSSHLPSVSSRGCKEREKLTRPDTARTYYYSHLMHKMFQVREYAEGTAHYAFLQARQHVVTDTAQCEGVSPKASDMMKWELVASGYASGRGAAHWAEKSGRLVALKNLQKTVEEQGMLSRVWGRWNEELQS